MFLTDPALRRIAAATNEVLPDQLWRFDTAAEDAVGDLARLLHKTAREYNATVAYLDSAVPHLTARPELRTAGGREAVSGMLAAIERHQVLSGVLIDAYSAWRRHRALGGGDEQHLLVYSGDPAYGVITLSRTSPRFWRATSDAEAAEAFDVPYAGRIVGLIAETPDGRYEATACSNQAHAESGSPIAYRLPDQDDLTTACRSLLRWWQLRHSAAWRSRNPDQLEPAELDQLAA